MIENKTSKKKTIRDTILIVDDVYMNRALLSQMFWQDYSIIEAEDGQKAMEIIVNMQSEIAVVLLDIKMPVADGFEVMEFMKKCGYMKQIPVILITGDEEGNAMEIGYTLGATDVIFKPFNAKVVMQRVHNVMELYRHKNHLEELVKEQTEELTYQYGRLKEHHDHLVSVLHDIIDYRNVESGEHVEYVQGYTRILANHYAKLYPKSKMTSQKIEYIVRAARLHDIGKITMPDAILSKSGNLSKWEMEMLKEHTTKGYELAKVMSEFEDEEYSRICCNVCLYHHEKYDKSGYPGIVRKERIPIEAQLVGLADMYDALVHADIHRMKLSKEQAVLMLLNGECGELSPRMKECLLDAKDDLAYFVI